MKLLSIGTVVLLKEGERKLIVTSRTPLVNKEGVIGYCDNLEEEYRRKYEKQIDNIQYPKLKNA